MEARVWNFSRENYTPGSRGDWGVRAFDSVGMFVGACAGLSLGTLARGKVLAQGGDILLVGGATDFCDGTSLLAAQDERAIDVLQ